MSDSPVKCIRCGERPHVESYQFRKGHPWAGQTGWRVFCAGGKHHAQVGLRRHKVDAVSDWNKKQAECAASGTDPAKMYWRVPA